jgi:tetratricopeptide (TPR) repeat protein
LAYRAAVRVYIEGRVDRIVSGYSVVLHIIDTETGSFVHSVQDAAESGDDLIITLDRVTSELREKLGEAPERLTATRPAVEVMTPSFEAYRRYVRGSEYHAESRYVEASEQAREALLFDPDFVSAWSLLASSFGNQGLSDSARYATNEALRRKSRQTEETFLFMKARMTSFLDWELDKGLALWDRLIRINPTPGNYGNRAVVLTYLGRDEEALEANAKAIEMAPFGPGNILSLNRADCLITLGHFEEAGRAIRDIPKRSSRERREIFLALAQSDWARADSVFTTGVLEQQSPLEYEMFRASLEPSRGSLRAAMSRDENVASTYFIYDRYVFCYWKIHFLVITGPDEPTATFPECSDTTMPGLIVGGVYKAASGDAQSAVGFLDRIGHMPEHQQRKHKTDIVVLEAWIDAANGRWEKVTQALEPLTRCGRRPRTTNQHSIRWLAAEAYDKQGLIELAAEAFELVISPVLIPETELYFRASYVSQAHYRLVHLYSQLGKLDEARRHLTAFEAMFTDPDPELAPMLEEARSAVAELERGL